MRHGHPIPPNHDSTADLPDDGARRRDWLKAAAAAALALARPAGLAGAGL
ncbi:sulfonate ABC transporter substrate-binding protein, partial [Burkholderia sp. Ax-1720]|nr:sulfonate ABC transporter substrate-binding protein [Burkholderia sp. Ax-1720]